jgi:2-polyprenyl-3-methyl-5-hydroxy-6-metoxy-1,4-benzoquinol methylase
MDLQQLRQELQGIDIYLLDQILKGRYDLDHKILDAGCGGGRNAFWLLKKKYDIYGVDVKEDAIKSLIDTAKTLNLPIDSRKFSVSKLSELDYDTEAFDHIICSAVLHFAKSHTHFKQMFGELVRVLKPGGMFFIRMTSNIGIEKRVMEIENGVHDIPDGSIRYLLTKDMLAEVMNHHQLSFLEPLKTVNVDDVRCMSTLVLRKAEFFQ